MTYSSSCFCSRCQRHRFRERQRVYHADLYADIAVALYEGEQFDKREVGKSAALGIGYGNYSPQGVITGRWSVTSNPTAPDNWVRSQFMKERSMMSELSLFQMSILLWYASTPNVPYPQGGSAFASALNDLYNRALLERNTDGLPTVSERGGVFVNAIRSLPLPVRAPAPWVMPK